MGTWHLDQGLAVLKKQLENENPAIRIGTKGDKKHQGEVSDHNPEADGSVDAIDPMIDGKYYTFAKAQADVNAIVASRDPRIAYVIFNGHIISSTVEPWVWRIYRGEDPHTGHWHLSVNDKKHKTPKALWETHKRRMARIMATQFNTEDKNELRAAIDDRATVKPYTDSLGGSGSVVGRAVLNSGYPRRPGDDRTPTWENLQALQVQLDAVAADAAACKSMLLQLTSDPADEGFNNPIADAAEYAEDHEKPA